MFEGYVVSDGRWPAGSVCLQCGKPVRDGDGVYAHRDREIGTIAVHGDCMLNMVGGKMGLFSESEIKREKARQLNLLAGQQARKEFNFDLAVRKLREMANGGGNA